jgi:hypothetical protein
MLVNKLGIDNQLVFYFFSYFISDEVLSFLNFIFLKSILLGNSVSWESLVM